MNTNNITLLHNNSGDLVVPWIRNRLKNYFNIEEINRVTVYDSKKYILWIDYNDHSGWEIPHRARGLKVIVDHLWDSWIDENISVADNVLTLRAKNWMWIHDYFFYNDHNYKNQVATGRPDKFFLLLMNLKRDVRDQLYHGVTPYLSDSLYSYNGNGIAIEGDIKHSSIWQRYFNPEWYTKTNFSLVSETLPYSNPPRLFISEKSFKPFAFKHAFVTFGSFGTLAYLRSLGFETFDHVVDESYDLVADQPNQFKFMHENRLAHVISTVDKLHKEFKTGTLLFQDRVSLEKIEHNFNRLYNNDLVTTMWQNEVINPIMEFINA